MAPPDASTLPSAATLVATQRAPHAPLLPVSVPLSPSVATARNVTVLPRAEATAQGQRLVVSERVRYEVQKKLGEGTFGEVTLATDNDIARRVAVKRLKPEGLDDDTLLRFVGEVQVVGALEHPGIVPVHDVGLDEAGYFFVMKYIDGETLESVIARLRAGDPAYLARYTMEARTTLFLQLCRAVQFAHSRGIIHRDIKPANVMIGAYGEVVLMDWGLAKKISDTGAAGEVYEGRSRAHGADGTMLGHALGTPAYMAPEQARGEHDRTDGRSDVYSLSAVFYELLSTRHYLPATGSVGELLEAVKTHAPEAGPLTMHHKYRVPPELAWLVHRGLQKDPARRYASVEELCVRIQQVLEGNAPVQCPCTGLKRANGAWSDFIDGHPSLSIAVALCAVCFMLVGMVTTVMVLTR